MPVSAREKTLFISDLDGTLLDKAARVTAYTAETVNRLTDAGYSFSVATARTEQSVRGLLSGIRVNAPIILLNGVLIYDINDRKYLKIEQLNAEIAAKIREMLARHGADALVYVVDGEHMEVTKHYLSSENARLDRIFREDYIPPPAAAKRGETVYFTLAGRFEQMRPIHDEIKKIPGVAVVFSKDDYTEEQWFVECFSEKASKGSGVRFLRENYGFTRIVGFGDNINDIPLFAACDEAYAAANAKPEAKSAATRVIAGNDEDGVAKWLAENVL
ncbi:MAG: HAD family hydrolase [Oscillospiraceae bacterium]|jgi:Cof subfamily protein (haloacid dehalogenase superfamily)|nr:HAD family hydrolase [Oscillospiraceae bacterium]